MKIELAKHMLELNTIEEIKAAILDKRGVDEDWMAAGEEQFNDGAKMWNYEYGKELIFKHKNGKIGILMDSDPDGMFSSGVMYQWLKDRNFGKEIVMIIPEGKTHGIIESLIPEDLDLLIVPDASSSESDKHKKLKELNIDILVLDHHDFSEEEKTDYAIIINPRNAKCSYPNKNLSGAAVVYKFIEAIDKEEGLNHYKKYIDLAALSIVSDVMTTQQIENKAIVNIGTKNINNSFINALINSDFRIKEKDKIVPFTIGFYIIPPLNALIRIGSVEDKEEVFKALVGEVPIEPVVAKIKSLKSKQDRGKDPLITRIVMDLQKNKADRFPIIIAQAPANTPKSMTGLIAGQIAGMYCKPTILGHINNGVFTGSLRSLNNSTVENFKDFCIESGLVYWAAGHPSASGISLPVQNIEKLLNYAEENLPPYEKKYFVDLELKENRKELIAELEVFKDHYGPGFDKILLYDEVVVYPHEIKILGAKQNVINIHKDGFEYIQFNFKGEIPTEPSLFKIVGEPSVNEWMGQKMPQLVMEAFEITSLDF